MKKHMNEMETAIAQVHGYLSRLNILRRRSSGKVFFMDPDGFIILDITSKSRNAYTHRRLMPLPEEFDERQASEAIAEALRRLSSERSIRFSTGSVIFLDRHVRTEREVFESIGDITVRAYSIVEYRKRNGLDQLVLVK
jgi:hypothetical protein